MIMHIVSSYCPAKKGHEKFLGVINTVPLTLLVVVVCVIPLTCGSRDFTSSELVGTFRTDVQHKSTAEILELKSDNTYHHSFIYEGQIVFSRTGTWNLVNERMKIPEFPYPVDAHITLIDWRDVDYFREIAITEAGELEWPLDTIAPLKPIRKIRIWNVDELWRYLEGDYSFYRDKS